MRESERESERERSAKKGLKAVVARHTRARLGEEAAAAVGNWVNIQDGAAQFSAIFSGGFAIFSHLLNTRYVPPA